MMGVAVMAVLLAAGVPSFQSIIASSRLATVTNSMVGTLALARTEAIRRGTRVTVCKSSDAAQCATTGDWRQGWIVFLDSTRTPTTARVDPGERIIASTEAIGNNMVIQGSGAVIAFVSYSSDGQTKLMNGSSQSGVVRVCNPSTAIADNRRARDIEINAVGRVASNRQTNVAATCPAP